MVTRREALAGVLASRRARLLAVARQMAKRRAPASLTKTRYTNRKNRPIYESVRISYIVMDGPRVLYGRKAHGPTSILGRAPHQIRPRHRR